MKKNTQKSTDFEIEKSTKWFPGLKQFIWTSKLHLSEQYEQPMNIFLSLLLFLVVILVPYFGFKKWYYLLEALIAKDYYFWNSAAQCLTTGSMALFVNLFYMVLYMGKWPGVEKFKGSNEPWPWVTDKNWNYTLTRMIVLTFINSVISIAGK